ncbi:MAG: hypothetical protein AAGD86_03060, partial [Pseudomonadota bacterium]
MGAAADLQGCRKCRKLPGAIAARRDGPAAAFTLASRQDAAPTSWLQPLKKKGGPKAAQGAWNYACNQK